jgi:hypothetical protein
VAPQHVLSDASLADLNAKPAQFAVNPGSTPHRVLAAHPSDQIADAFQNCGPSGLAAPTLPSPEKPKAFAMPSDDRFRLDDY